MNAKDSYDQDDPYEEEETLSLCDLPIYSDSAEWENFSKEDQISASSFSSSSSSSSSSANQDFFEFSSGELSSTTSSSTYPPFENIVFCGKVITSKEPLSDTAAADDESKKQPAKPRKRGIFRWNLKLFRRRRSRTSKPTVRKSKTSKSVSLPASESPEKCGHKATAAKGGEKYGFSVRRVPMLASPTKSRWHLLMFGLTRLPPAEMELSDIRSRQCRRSPSALFPPPLRSGFDEKESRGKGLWGLIRVLGCGGHRSLDLHRGNAPVVA